LSKEKFEKIKKDVIDRAREMSLEELSNMLSVACLINKDIATIMMKMTESISTGKDVLTPEDKCYLMESGLFSVILILTEKLAQKFKKDQQHNIASNYVMASTSIN
jgi:hypothetical protein